MCNHLPLAGGSVGSHRRGNSGSEGAAGSMRAAARSLVSPRVVGVSEGRGGLVDPWGVAHSMESSWGGGDNPVRFVGGLWQMAGLSWLWDCAVQAFN